MFIIEDWMEINEIAIKVCEKEVLKQSTDV
jgi:hypothetical protein